MTDIQTTTPGDPAMSMLYQRMNRRRDVFNMPPLATHQIDQEAVGVVAQWIKSLPVRRE